MKKVRGLRDDWNKTQVLKMGKMEERGCFNYSLKPAETFSLLLLPAES